MSLSGEKNHQIPSAMVSDRTSSKLKIDYVNRRKEINEDIKQARKRIKKSSSFNVEYWSAKRVVSEYKLQLKDIQKKSSVVDMFGDASEDKTRAFLMTAEGRRISEEERALELETKLLAKQESRITERSKDRSLRQAFLQMFVGAWGGLHLQNSAGPRKVSDQTHFRDELHRVMRLEDPDKSSDLKLCPVTGLYHEDLVAAHLFPWKSGKAAMEAIFGPADPKDSSKSDLFEPANGILWSKKAEELFTAGLLTIVPDIPDTPTKKQMQDWQQSSPKEYKIRILDLEAPLAQIRILRTEVRGRDLDGRRLQFMTAFRPKARYLYFAYCEAMLRQAYNRDHEVIMGGEVRKKFWGSPGSYMKKNMLLAFVEELGHDHEYLMSGAMEQEPGEIDEPVESALAFANSNILQKMKPLAGERTEHEQMEMDSEEEDCEAEAEADELEGKSDT